MVESPRWLISKGRDSRAYKMVFRKKIPVELSKRLLVEKPSPEPAEKAPEKKIGIGTRIKNGASEVTALYATSKLRTRAFICHFTWCVTSLCYYITGEQLKKCSRMQILIYPMISIFSAQRRQPFS